MKSETKKLIVIGLVAVGVIGSGVAGFFLTRNKLDSKENQDSNSVIKKEEEDKKNPDKDVNLDKEEDKKPSEDLDEKDDNDVLFDTDGNSTIISNNKKPSTNGNPSVIPSNPTNPSVPSNPVKPEEPTTPDKPIENPGETEEPDDNNDSEDVEKPDVPINPVIEDLVITNDMIKNDTFFVKNETYQSVTLSSDIRDYVKIVLDQVEINGDLTLEDSGNYQLDIIDSKMKSFTTKSVPKFYSRMAVDFGTKNKALQGPTVNFDEKSTVQSLTLNHSIEVNGTNRVSNIMVQGGEEVVLNIPAQSASIQTNGTVAVNQKIDKITNEGSKNTIIVNAPVTTFLNQVSSTIHINQKNTITTLNNSGENTVVSGNGTIVNASIQANNTRIYTEVTNKPVLKESVDNVIVRKESKNQIVSAVSKSQGSVTFTLAEAVDSLSIEDISVICNAGKTITLYRLSTEDNKTFTLTTSYYKNDSYALYITLPNGNIVSRDFDTDYANPTVQNVVLERVSDTKAMLELYGVDEGGKIYYVLEDALTKEVIDASSIQKNGKSASVKVGYNALSIDGLKVGKSYRLYYVIEGYFGNVSKVKGPFELSSQVKEETKSEYKIVYAEEEIANRFVFQLNKVPDHELTLEDFIIKCPTQKNLTTKGATFQVSPDLLTYIIIVPDNYGHKDNKYTVDVKISAEETIHGSFVSHFDPPTITGAVDNVVRVDENTANFSFYSDEAGTVYYGIYDWNGGIYDYNSSTPFASDVLTGAISSKQQVLNTGANTIMLDLSGVTVTKNTRVWALFVDSVGNYRVGFVDHYKIPEDVSIENPEPDSSLKITKFEIKNNKNLSIDFSEVIGWVSSDDIQISVLEGGSLPSKLLYSIDNDTPKHLNIDILNYELPVGVYELKLTVFDENDTEITLVQRIEIS